MMNIKESLKKTQGRGAGFVNGSSAKFAQLLIEEGESVEAAVTANIFTRKGHFPVLSRSRTNGSSPPAACPASTACRPSPWRS